MVSAAGRHLAKQLALLFFTLSCLFHLLWCYRTQARLLTGCASNFAFPGIVQSCIEARGVSGATALAGTFLLPAGNLSYEAGGYCDDSPPTCDLDVGCRCEAVCMQMCYACVCVRGRDSASACCMSL